MKMTAKVVMGLLLLAVLAACAPAPAPVVGPDYEATIAGWSAWCETCGATLSVLEAKVEQATPVPPPAPTLVPSPTPEYRVIECGIRPPNGTLIRMVKPMTSRACHDSRCRNQGQVVIGSVRPVEWLAYDEDSGEVWLRFTYLPIEGKPYNLLQWEKKGGNWQWVLEWQFVLGEEDLDFECVEPWAE